MPVLPVRYLSRWLITKPIKFYKRMPSLMTFTHFKVHMEFESIMFKERGKFFFSVLNASQLSTPVCSPC